MRKSDKQEFNKEARYERFCHEYIRDFNATRAATEAGYSPKTAYAQGCRMLKYAEIQARIKELIKQALGNTDELTLQWLNEVKTLAFLDRVTARQWGLQGAVSLKNNGLNLLGKYLNLLNEKPEASNVNVTLSVTAGMSTEEREAMLDTLIEERQKVKERLAKANDKE